jgi:hypothetical protein
MSEMIERIASVMYSEDAPGAWTEAVRIANRYPDEKHFRAAVEETRAMARRVLMAIRSPTDEMANKLDLGGRVARDIWQAMVDEALAGVTGRRGE